MSDAFRVAIVITRPGFHGYMVPLGYLYVSAVLKQAGFDVRVVNASAASGDQWEFVRRALEERRPGLVITGTSDSALAIFGGTEGDISFSNLFLSEAAFGTDLFESFLGADAFLDNSAVEDIFEFGLQDGAAFSKFDVLVIQDERRFAIDFYDHAFFHFGSFDAHFFIPCA